MRLKKEGQRQGQEQEQQELQQRQRRLDPIIYRVTTGSLSYTEMEIDAAKASPSFEREYNLKYLGLIGNVFHIKDIETAI
jgi:hypothetical protein